MKTLRVLLTLIIALRWVNVLAAQAVSTAGGPGGYVAVGGGASGFQSDYGHRTIGGGLVYADVNPQWRIGLEGEARFLRWHDFEQVTESTYVGGLRVAVLRPRRWNPYAKFLAGVGKITLPYGYAHGSFLTYAPGAGLDVAVADRLTLRLVDFEYQRWPQFSYGALSPYGISAGLSVRLNGVPHLPKGARAKH